MLRKLSLLFAALFLLLPVAPAFSQTALNIAPELNEICWKKKDCTAIRKQIAGSESGGVKPDEGFVQEAPCEGGKDDEAWGKCLPANIAVTEIAFGGQRRFLGLGDFLTSTYKIALSVASILAVIMIIMSGFQWTTSAGNSEVISAAKHHISGALIGLFIAYSSYLILSTINPDLVNLRLPQTWLLRPQAEVPKFCAAASSTSEFAYAADSTREEQKKILSDAKPGTYEKYTENNKTTFWCGKRFFVKNGGTATCFGNYCPNSGESCLNIHYNDLTDNSYYCEATTMVGKIYANNAVKPICAINPGYKPAISAGKLRLLCGKDGKFTVGQWVNGRADIRDIPGTETQIYKVTNFSVSGASCGSGYVPAYALDVTVSRNCQPGGDWHLVGKNGEDLNSKYVPGAGGGIQVDISSLFSPEELATGGIENNLDVATFKLGDLY